MHAKLRTNGPSGTPAYDKFIPAIVLVGAGDAVEGPFYISDPFDTAYSEFEGKFDGFKFGDAELKVSGEIQANFPNGAKDQTKRAVSENARTLGLKNADWE